LRKDLPAGTKIIDSVWAMKKKSNGRGSSEWISRQFFCFFLFLRDTQNSKSKKIRKNKRTTDWRGEALSTMTFSPLPSLLPLDQTISFP
jgi:hypothetical protein